MKSMTKRKRRAPRRNKSEEAKALAAELAAKYDQIREAEMVVAQLRAQSNELLREIDEKDVAMSLLTEACGVSQQVLDRKLRALSSGLR